MYLKRENILYEPLFVEIITTKEGCKNIIKYNTIKTRYPMKTVIEYDDYCICIQTDDTRINSEIIKYKFEATDSEKNKMISDINLGILQREKLYLDIKFGVLTKVTRIPN